MNYIILLLLLAFTYYLIKLKNKSLLFLFLIIIAYVYYENLLPKSFWEIPQPTYKKTYEFNKLDNLINEYKKSSPENAKIIKKNIQKEINTIYFSFPNHEHSQIDDYLYKTYNF